MNKKLILSIIACLGACSVGLGLLRMTTADQGGSQPYTAGYRPIALEENANTPPGMSIGR